MRKTALLILCLMLLAGCSTIMEISEDGRKVTLRGSGEGSIRKPDGTVYELRGKPLLSEIPDFSVVSIAPVPSPVQPTMTE